MLAYKKGDLFTQKGKASLAHCVSADLEMGAGIATGFKSNFYKGGMVSLVSQCPTVGSFVFSKDGEHFVYNLVTKEKYWEKPKLLDLFSSLMEMADHAMANGVKEICIPKLGCGLDRLDWTDVEAGIKEIFSGTGIKITVYIIN